MEAGVFHVVPQPEQLLKPLVTLGVTGSTWILFSLCVSLCACSGVSREDYDATVANYKALAANYEA